MKFYCNQQDLIKKLNIVSKAVSSRTTIPSLKGVYMELNSNNLKMTSSDMDITIEVIMEVEGKEDGSIVVPYKIFSDLVRKLPNDEIEVSSNNGNINVKCRNSNSSIVGMEGSEFPIIKTDESNKESITLKKDILSKMIRNTSFAASIDQTKGVLSGVLIEINKDYLKTVAIDGYRMAINKEECENKGENNFIISARLINEVNKIFSDVDEEDIEILYDDKNALIIIDDVKVSLRMIAGEFIKYNDIIPKEEKIKVRVRRDELINAIERASIMTEGKNNLIKISVVDNVLTVSSNSEEGGSIEDVLVNKEGDNIVIGFNARYMIDVLKVIDDEEIMLNLNTPLTPCIITPVGGDEFIYLVLPVRI